MKYITLAASVTLLVGAALPSAALLVAATLPAQAEQIKLSPQQAAEIVAALTPDSKTHLSPLEDPHPRGTATAHHAVTFSAATTAALAHDLDAAEHVLLDFQRYRLSVVSALSSGAQAVYNAQAIGFHLGSGSSDPKLIFSPADATAADRAAAAIQSRFAAPVTVDVMRISAHALNIEGNNESVAVVAALLPLITGLDVAGK